jgi:hypothetical protein
MTKRWTQDDYASPAEDAAQRAQLEAEARRTGRQPWEVSAERAVPTNVVRDVVNDFRSPAPLRSQVEKPPERGTGWYTPPALRPPDGINHVDAIGQSFDVQERAAKLAELKQTLRVLKGEA